MTKNITPAARKTRNALYTSRAAFSLGVVVSIGANIYASDHTPIGLAVGLWTPVAFIASMMMVENVPARGWQGWARRVAMAFIALIAGWVSYWHLVDVATAGGADVLTAHLLPLTVDVMMALASPGIKRKVATTATRRPAAKKGTANVRKLRPAA